jgi:transcriptional regulator with XRE-family HTH domain
VAVAVCRDRLDGLLDEPRPGRPRTVTDAQLEEVIVRTLETTPRDATDWSTRSLAAELGLSQSAVSRIWRAFGLQPHRQQTWKLSRDRQFVDFVLHFTPTSSSWLNLVERWFAELTTKKLRRGSHRPVRDLNADIPAWIETWNDNPRPLVWTKTAHDILESIAHYCRRTNDSGHY